MITEQFFELLQVAIGNRMELTSRLSDEEWAMLYDMAKKQALVGIAFKGCERLPKEQRPQKLLFLKWSGMAMKLKEKNERLNRECVEVTEELRRAGLHSVILKGQGNLVNYVSSGGQGGPEGPKGPKGPEGPEGPRVPEGPCCLADYRTPGDIDVWAWADEGGIRRVIEFAKKHRLDHGLTAMPWHRIVYYHAESALDSGTEVEIHYRPSYLNSFSKNRRLLGWFHEVSRAHDVPEGSRVPVVSRVSSSLGFPIPSNGFNAVYQLLHIYKHLFEQGVGLRQILDYYFVLCSGYSDLNKEEVMKTLSSFGMRKFAGAMMFVLQRVFAMADVYLLCAPDPVEGEFLLNEILMGGNFGKHDERIVRGSKSFCGFSVSGAWLHAIEKTRHNFRLLGHYPEEVLWEPVFRVYHFCWRALRLWRFE